MLAPCPNCGHQLSTEATVCVQCGRHIPTSTKAAWAKAAEARRKRAVAAYRQRTLTLRQAHERGEHPSFESPDYRAVVGCPRCRYKPAAKG
jgi:predicted amidophosphoribosyltransferase